jgi:hypothetical protein
MKVSIPTSPPIVHHCPLEAFGLHMQAKRTIVAALSLALISGLATVFVTVSNWSDDDAVSIQILEVTAQKEAWILVRLCS